MKHAIEYTSEPGKALGNTALRFMILDAAKGAASRADFSTVEDTTFSRFVDAVEACGFDDVQTVTGEDGKTREDVVMVFSDEHYCYVHTDGTVSAWELI